MSDPIKLSLLFFFATLSICQAQDWQLQLGEANKEAKGYKIQSSPDGNFVVAGWTESYSAQGLDGYIIKVTPQGDTLWSKVYEGSGDNRLLDILPLANEDIRSPPTVFNTNNFIKEVVKENRILTDDWESIVNKDITDSSEMRLGNGLLVSAPLSWHKTLRAVGLDLKHYGQ